MRTAICVLGAVVFVASCGTPRSTAVEWGTEAEVVDRGTGTAPLPETQEEFDVYANTILTGQVCQDNARALLATDKKKAAMLLKGCITRNDFLSMLELSQPPWSSLKYKDRDLERLINLAMRRGGMEVAEDLSLVGFKVQNWDTYRHGPRSDKELVTARVQVIKSTPTSNGASISLVRVYGFDDGRSEYSHSVMSGAGKIVRETTRYGRDSKNVVPVGATLEVRSAGPLPEVRKLQIVGRYLKRETDALLAKNREYLLNLPPDEAAAVKITDEDPRPDGVIELMAHDTDIRTNQASNGP